MANRSGAQLSRSAGKGNGDDVQHPMHRTVCMHGVQLRNYCGACLAVHRALVRSTIEGIERAAILKATGKESTHEEG